MIDPCLEGVKIKVFMEVSQRVSVPQSESLFENVFYT